MFENNLVEIYEEVVEGVLGVAGAKVPEGLDGLHGFLSAVELLHHDGHVLERALHPVTLVYGLPEPQDRSVQVLLHQLHPCTASCYWFPPPIRMNKHSPLLNGDQGSAKSLEQCLLDATN